MPIEPPSCRPTLSTAEASPDSLGLTPEMAAAVRTARAPQVNSDDEAVELIDARIRVADTARLRGALVARPDIRATGGGELLWLGRTLESDDPRRPTLAAPTMVGKKPSVARRTGSETVVKATLRFEKGADNWEPTDPKAWKVIETKEGKFYSQFQQSKYNPPHRSPLNFASTRMFQAVGQRFLDDEKNIVAHLRRDA